MGMGRSGDKRRIMLTVAYDGTNYSGFALQKNAPTIEGLLNRALHALTGEDIEVIGASRTDAGVHALGNVAVFDTASPVPPENFARALDKLLPPDVRIMRSREVPSDFHPRRTDCVKTYEYRILNAAVMPPTLRLYACRFGMPLEVSRMREAAAYLVGTHDFTSFCNVNSQAPDHVRTIYALEVNRSDTAEGAEGPCDTRSVQQTDGGWGGLVTIRVEGNGFLYNMVRIIAGTLMQIGRGKGAPEDIPRMLEARSRAAAGPTAPPEGLFLIGYTYPALEKPAAQNENGQGGI